MKKYVFESLKFFCAAILCTILSAFATPALADLDPCRNLLDPEWTQNKGTNGSNGNVVDSEGWSITDLIPVEPGQYVWSMSALYQTYTFYYDTNKQFISPHGGPKDTQERQITIPSNAKYVRLQIKAVGDSLSSMQQQLERGDTATAYTPYNPLCATCDGTVVNYTSATGTGVQNGTPTPENPIEPVFYQQGNMVLRKVGDYADTYDTTTGKITRRVGVKVLDGTEDWIKQQGSTRYGVILNDSSPSENLIPISSHFVGLSANTAWNQMYSGSYKKEKTTSRYYFQYDTITTIQDWEQYLAQQYANGTPVTIYYPLAEETTEDWPASYCETPIKIATTKYNETAFGPLNTALQNAISVVDSVVSNTITQAASIATLQTQKQTRPNDIADDSEKCPAGKKCLLVEDASGTPHWYEIVERYSRLPDGYTELQWIESTGTQYIDTGLNPKPNVTSVEFELAVTDTSIEQIFGARQAASATGGSYNIFANVSPNQFRLDWVGNGYTNVNDIVLGTFYKFVLNADGSVDFNNLHFERAETKTECNYNMYLFGGNNAGTTALGKVRYKGAVKIKERDTLVRDFVPAKNASGVVGMYDTVSGVFYENKGTGEFIAGDPVVE